MSEVRSNTDLFARTACKISPIAALRKRSGKIPTYEVNIRSQMNCFYIPRNQTIVASANMSKNSSCLLQSLSGKFIAKDVNPNSVAIGFMYLSNPRR